MAADEDETVEVFRADNRMAAQAAIDSVLGPLGIQGFLHDRSQHTLPVPAIMRGAYFVAVLASRADEAMTALEEAVADGAIDGEVGETVT
jgi:hypothetical protein